MGNEARDIATSRIVEWMEERLCDKISCHQIAEEAVRRSFDAGGGMSRYDAARVQLENLQNEMPGEIAVASFSSSADFSPSGVPINQGGTTDMVQALKMMLMADNTDIRLILISDGEPDDSAAALATARKFKSKIDTIFVGNETGFGRKFLQELAAATGGVSIVNKTEDLGLLKDNLTLLLNA